MFQARKLDKHPELRTAILRLPHAQEENPAVLLQLTGLIDPAIPVLRRVFGRMTFGQCRNESSARRASAAFPDPVLRSNRDPAILLEHARTACTAAQRSDDRRRELAQGRKLPTRALWICVDTCTFPY